MSPSPDFYCGACDICYYETSCPECGGPHLRHCKKCERRMEIMGDTPPQDVLCQGCAFEFFDELSA